MVRSMAKLGVWGGGQGCGDTSDAGAEGQSPVVGWRGQMGTENLGEVSGVCLWPGYKPPVLLPWFLKKREG